jgi:hypothetical protein
MTVVVLIQSWEVATEKQISSIPPEPPGMRRRCWWIFLITILLYILPSPIVGPGHFLLTKSRAESWNDQARIATVESITERGTLAIDRSKWGWFTGDKVFLRDHFYATKPPLLSAIGAASYWILRKAAEVATGQKITYLKNEDVIYPWVTLTTSVLAFALLLVYFFRALHLVNIAPSARWWLFWALAIGSLYPAYSTVFNNHTVAGAFMFVGFYYVLRYRLGGPLRWWEVVVAGLSAGFAGVTDYTGALPFLVLLLVIMGWQDMVGSGLVKRLSAQRGAVAISLAAFLALGLMLLPKLGPRGVSILLIGPTVVALIAAGALAARHRPMTLLFLLGILAPIVVHLFLNSRITGNWLPTYIQSDVYIATPPGYFGEVVSPEEAGLLFWPRWKYIGTAIFGIRGDFLYTPAMLFGLIATLVAAFRKGSSMKLEAIAVALTVVVGWGYVLLFGSPNFGGTSFGFRYSLPAVPLLIFFCYRFFESGSARIWSIMLRNAIAWGVFVAIVAIPYPWGVFGQLPQTQNSLVENLQYIAVNTLLTLTK